MDYGTKMRPVLARIMSKAKKCHSNTDVLRASLVQNRGLHMLRFAAAIMVASVTAWGAAAQEKPLPSFDCAKARQADEMAICSDARLSEIDRLQASAYAKAKYHPNKAAVVKRTREYLGYRRDCGSDRRCIKTFQRELINGYFDLGLSFSLPAWANEEGISADAYCMGVFVKDDHDGPGEFRKGDEIEIQDVSLEDGKRFYGVFRTGQFAADGIRLKDPNCVLRKSGNW